MCTGFWSGIISYILLVVSLIKPGTDTHIIEVPILNGILWAAANVIMHGLVGSIAGVFTGSILESLEAVTYGSGYDKGNPEPRQPE